MPTGVVTYRAWYAAEAAALTAKDYADAYAATVAGLLDPDVVSNGVAEVVADGALWKVTIFLTPLDTANCRTLSDGVGNAFYDASIVADWRRMEGDF